MALNEFIFDVNATTGNAGHLTLVQGAFAFVSGLVASTGGLNIETPVANIGIRGTVGGATCTSAGTVRILRGSGDRRSEAGEPSTVHAPDRRSIRQRPVCRRNSDRECDGWGECPGFGYRCQHAATSYLRAGRRCGPGTVGSISATDPGFSAIHSWTGWPTGAASAARAPGPAGSAKSKSTIGSESGQLYASDARQRWSRQPSAVDKHSAADTDGAHNRQFYTASRYNFTRCDSIARRRSTPSSAPSTRASSRRRPRCSIASGCIDDAGAGMRFVIVCASSPRS